MALITAWALVVPGLNIIYIIACILGSVLCGFLIMIHNLREKAIACREKAEQDRAIEKIRKYHEYEKNQSSRNSK